MGVPGFFAWLLKNKKKLGTKNLIINNIGCKIKYLMLDTNCLLHPCVANILEKYKKGELRIDNKQSLRTQIESYIWNLIERYIEDMVSRVKPEYLYIAIDGVAPIGKILQQRQRRYRYLYDKSIKLNNNSETEVNIKANGICEPIIPISSIELTPGTDYMERIHENMLKFVSRLNNSGTKAIYSSYHEEGEGEHKILQYIKKNTNTDDSVIIYGLDADLLFLALGTGEIKNIYIMREVQVFNNKELDLDEFPEYNYVEIKELQRLINNLEISTTDFVVLSYMIGNDFLPGMLTLDVKKGGLDKIFEAFQKVLTKSKISLRNEYNIITNKLVIQTENNNYELNHELLKEMFKELVWTEKYTWKNINRDRFLSQRDVPLNELEARKLRAEEDRKDSILKFVSGLSDCNDCLTKVEFNSSEEFYSYYLGINTLDLDSTIISKMVQDYITGLTWCLNYYLNECGSWSWGYNFMVAPTITDIIKYYPNSIHYNQSKRELNPVEQLILAIPPETYKYVIESDIIKKLQNNKKIGYMFPISYDLDINIQSKMWKCQVKIPIVEYNEYLKEIKKLNIVNNKNL